MISNKKHFLFNLSSLYLSIVVGALVSFITVPIALSYWGKEVYAIWIIIVSFSNYILASGLGIDAATGNLMTKNPGVNQKIAILKKGLASMFFSCLIAMLLFSLLNFINPEWYKIIGKMSETEYKTVKPAMIAFVIVTIIVMPFSVVSSSFAAFGKAYVNTFINMVQSILNIGILLIVKFFCKPLWFYIILIGISNLLVGSVKIICLVSFINEKKNIVQKCLYALDISDNTFCTIIKTGVNLSLYGLPIMLVPNLSNLLISNFLDIRSVVPYSIEYKLFTTAMGVVMAINMAAAPLLGIEFGNQNWSWLKVKIHKMLTMTIFLGICLANGMIYFSKYVIILWTQNADNFPGEMVTALLALWVFLYCLNNVSLVTINSFNYTNRVWLVSWFESFVFLLVAVLSIKYIGVISIPLGLFISVLTISFFAYPNLIRKRSNGRINIFSSSTLKGGCLIVVFALVHYCLILLKLRTEIEVSLSLLVYCISVVMAFFVLEETARQDILATVKTKWMYK